MIVGPHGFGFIKAAIATAASYTDEVLLDTPTMYWKLDETSGTTATDKAGNFDGTYNGDYTLNRISLTNSGRSVQLDGSTGRIESNWDGVLGSNAWTIEFWTFIQAFEKRTFVSWGTASTSEKFVLRTDAGRVRFENTGGNIIFTPAIDDSLIHHVVVVYPGGGANLDQVRCWIDRNEATVESVSNNSMNLTAGEPVKVGVDSFGNHNNLDGYIDELAIYEKALSESRIQKHYDLGVKESFSGTTSTILYDFEDGTLQGLVSNIPEFDVSTQVAQSGTYSAGVDNTTSITTDPVAYVEPSVLSGGKEVRRITYFAQETSNSSGAYLAAIAPDGNEVIGAGLDNPEWLISDTNGKSQVESRSGTYDRWIKIDIEFDWISFKASVTFEDLQNSDKSSFSGRPFNTASPIERIEIIQFSTFASDDNNMQHWIDNLEIEVPD